MEKIDDILKSIQNLVSKNLLDEALELLNNSLEKYNEVNYKYSLLSFKAYIYNLKDNLRKSLDVYKDIINEVQQQKDLSKKDNEKFILSTTYYNMALVEKKMNQNKKAYHFIKQSYTLLYSIKNLKEIEEDAFGQSIIKSIENAYTIIEKELSVRIENFIFIPKQKTKNFVLYYTEGKGFEIFDHTGGIDILIKEIECKRKNTKKYFSIKDSLIKEYNIEHIIVDNKKES